MILQWILAVSACVALVIPIVFIRIRESTKLRRQGIVEDLASVFERVRDDGVLIPSFEFVKYKYFVPSRERGGVSRRADDYRAIHWMLGAIPLVFVLFVLKSSASPW